MEIFFSAKKSSLIFLMLILSFWPVSYSQDVSSCAENLKTAQALFDRGQVDQVPGLLTQCLKSGFSREESLTAYKLLIQSYLFEEDQEKYDSTMLEFLKKNPEYQLSSTDHSRFIYLYNNFQVKPVLKLGFHIGFNLPFITNIYGEPVVESTSSYNTGLNLYISFLEAKYALTRRIELNAEAAYSKIAFTDKRVFSGQDQTLRGVTIYDEEQTRLEFPITATMDFISRNKFTLFGRLGGGPAIALGSKASVAFEPSDINGQPLSESGLSRDASRIPLDIFVQAGGGVKYKIRNGYFLAEIRSGFGIFNQNTGPNPSRENDSLGRDYYYSDNNFNLNTLNFNVGYTYIFYKPSKIR